MYDASPWGVGICRAHALPDVVASVGRYSERWRFKNHENVSMRVLAHRAIVQHVFQESGAEAAEQLRVRILSGKKFLLSGIDPADLNEDSFIPMVPRVLGSYLDANWRTCVSSPWSDDGIFSPIALPQSWVRAKVARRGRACAELSDRSAP